MKRNYLLAGLLLAAIGTIIVTSCIGNSVASEPVSSVGNATNTNTPLKEEPAQLAENEIQYVDLGLPSGTLWATENEKMWCSTWGAYRIGNVLPTAQQYEELINKCHWKWEVDECGRTGYTVIGPNGNSIFFPANGYLFVDPDGEGSSIIQESETGIYISSTKDDGSNNRNYREEYMTLYFNVDGPAVIGSYGKNKHYSVRIVKNQK